MKCKDNTFIHNTKIKMLKLCEYGSSTWIPVPKFLWQEFAKEYSPECNIAREHSFLEIWG